MLRTLAVLAILVPGIVLAFTSRLRALLLYLWFAFFRPQEWVWFDIAQFRLSVVLALIFVVPALVSGVFPNLTHPLSIGALLFLGSGLLAQTNALDPDIGWYWLQFFSQMTLVYLLAVSVIRTPRDLMRVIAVVAGCLGYYATKAGLVSMFSGGVRFADGLAGAFVDNNGYALAVVMIMPMLVALAQNARLTFEGLVPSWAISWITLGLYLSVPLCAYAVISTFSRSGFLGLVAATATFVLLHHRRFRLIVAMAAIAALAATLPLPQGYADRLASIGAQQGESFADDSGGGRLHFWGVAVEMAADHPLGVGMRNFQSRYSAYDTLGGSFGENRDVHSSHMQVLSEQGYLGFAVWVAQFVFALVVAWRVRKRSRTPGLPPGTQTFLLTVPTALIVSMAGFLVAGSFISLALNELTWLTFALLASLDLMSLRLCSALKEQHGSALSER